MEKAKLKCPRCGSEDTKTKKSWVMNNPKSETLTEISIHFCRDCGNKFRTGTRIKKEE